MKSTRGLEIWDKNKLNIVSGSEITNTRVVVKPVVIQEEDPDVYQGSLPLEFNRTEPDVYQGRLPLVIYRTNREFEPQKDMSSDDSSDSRENVSSNRSDEGSDVQSDYSLENDSGYSASTSLDSIPDDAWVWPDERLDGVLDIIDEIIGEDGGM